MSKNFFFKAKGGGPIPPAPSLAHIGWSWAGGCIAISFLSYLSLMSGFPLLIAPFGATCVLAFGAPDLPLSQPRSIIGGHFLASAMGFIFLNLLGSTWLSFGLAVATSIAVMQLTRTVHAPAGADPLVILMSPTISIASFLPNVLLGSTVLVLIATLFNNLNSNRHYPKYW